MLKAKIF